MRVKNSDGCGPEFRWSMRVPLFLGITVSALVGCEKRNLAMLGSVQVKVESHQVHDFFKCIGLTGADLLPALYGGTIRDETWVFSASESRCVVKVHFPSGGMTAFSVPVATPLYSVLAEGQYMLAMLGTDTAYVVTETLQGAACERLSVSLPDGRFIFESVRGSIVAGSVESTNTSEIRVNHVAWYDMGTRMVSAEYRATDSFYVKYLPSRFVELKNVIRIDPTAKGFLNALDPLPTTPPTVLLWPEDVGPVNRGAILAIVEDGQLRPVARNIAGYGHPLVLPGGDKIVVAREPPESYVLQRNREFDTVLVNLAKGSTKVLYHFSVPRGHTADQWVTDKPFVYHGLCLAGDPYLDVVPAVGYGPGVRVARIRKSPVQAVGLDPTFSPSLSELAFNEHRTSGAMFVESDLVKPEINVVTWRITVTHAANP